MASRTLSRALLILALIVAAHAFKPISSKSVIEQLLGAAESLSFVLPDFAEVRLAQASYLAAAFAQEDRSTNDLEIRNTQLVPAAFELDTIRNRENAAPCGKSEAGVMLAKAKRSRMVVARATRPKQLIPELPEAMPLSRALAMTVPVGEVELRLLPAVRLSERQLLRRALFLPASMRPMVPVRKQRVAECDAISIGSPDGDLDLRNAVGPQEELDFWEFGDPIEPSEEEFEFEMQNPQPERNCQIAVPPTAPLPLELGPQEYE